MDITILTTGGTIDKDYPHTTKGWAFEIGEPAVTDILAEWDSDLVFNIKSILKKDSLEITNEDRQLLVTSIGELRSDKVIITHGTDTIISTGLYLDKQNIGKTIVLTGSMRPAKFKNTDAYLNIGAAIGLVQILTPGVYITMNGMYGPANHVIRDPDNGKFRLK